MQSGAGDPEISWVSTTELVDLSEYLDGGELVLTTGLSLSADDPRWRDFVADLSRARVAAIGFGIGVVHEHIPDPLGRESLRGAMRVGLQYVAQSYHLKGVLLRIAIFAALAGGAIDSGTADAT